MPHFDSPGPQATTPFGRNEFLRSTKLLLTDSFMLDKDSVASVTIDGSTEKVLQPGTVMARITAAGAKLDMVGPYDTTATDGRQTAANIVGINLTFLPWQLLNRDVEISVVYGAVVNTPWIIQYTAGAATVVSPATVTAIQGIARLGNLIFD